MKKWLSIYESTAFYLLSEGANKDAQNYVGWTALHYSALKGNLDIIKCLLYITKILKIKMGKNLLI